MSITRGVFKGEIEDALCARYPALPSQARADIVDLLIMRETAYERPLWVFNHLPARLAEAAAQITALADDRPELFCRKH